MSYSRFQNRPYNEMREVKVELGIMKGAEGSCLISFGDTKVICSATVEEKIPHFLKGSRQGWITAEYSMLPRSTITRIQRESTRGISGRTHEIQRLIGRSLRSIVDLKSLGERQILIDCDVIQADGGTRTAAITGSFIALCQAMKWLFKNKKINSIPINAQVAAISCGIVNGIPMVDLDYSEDSTAQVDANFVISSEKNLIEIQATAEGKSFSQQEFDQMLNLAYNSVQQLVKLQRQVLGL